ncbi:hypothetical protein ACTOB_003875 [Actinoplanes oblitus]|uniref:FXSXX-COOH protein n=1 Tax=Actinoplanes oblitus TaxID=3040509 RepID=A0ABY8WQQ0_9ACTN|nr:hypothetical protein [Actinoplanes oblitus]WIN00181.1 hypothetical protein ACTOB_003875 [Actinoplanes oblitus]
MSTRSVMVVDRPRLAESIGALAIDDSKVDPVQAVLDETMDSGRTTAASASATRHTSPTARSGPA